MRLDRWGANDTSLVAEQRYYELLRKLSPERRLAQTFELIELVRTIHIAGREWRPPESEVDRA